MRVPLSWLREYAELPEPVDGTEVARRLTGAGLEVEDQEAVGHDISVVSHGIKENRATTIAGLVASAQGAR